MNRYWPLINPFTDPHPEVPLLREAFVDWKIGYGIFEALSAIGVELPWADSEKIKNYLRETDHHKYGWAGLVMSQLFNMNRSAGKSQFCSQWCAAALSLPSPARYSPETLSELCGFVGSVASC